jgi:GH18 family chitinase
MNLKTKYLKREKYLIITVSLCIIVSLLIYGLFFYGKNTWKEDIDGDGVNETVKEMNSIGGGGFRIIKQEDGTIHHIMYNPDNKIMYEWKMVPDPNNLNEYIIYIRDEETQQWLLDQNKNGIPDKQEEK